MNRLWSVEHYEVCDACITEQEKEIANSPALKGANCPRCGEYVEWPEVEAGEPYYI